MKIDEKVRPAAQAEAAAESCCGDAKAETEAVECCGGAHEARAPRPTPAPRAARTSCCCG